MKNGLIILCLSIMSLIGMAEHHHHHQVVTLGSHGSEKTVNTIFTCPGEDASTMMNISFATPVGTTAVVKVMGGGSENTYVSKGELCTTFDSIPSVLRDGEKVTEHHVFDRHFVKLEGLKPNTRYTYHVMADSAGIMVSSDVHSFHTGGAKSWKAAIVGDFHHYSPLWFRLDSAMGMVDVLDSVAGGIDMVLSPGDITSYGGSFNSWTELSEQPEFMDNMWAIVPGNHDRDTRDKREESDKFFRDSHAFPLNGPEGLEGTTYWFKYGDVLFLMLNSESSQSSEKHHALLDWMEKVINNHPSRYVVVVQHRHWLQGTDGTGSQLDYFREFFDRVGVDLAISGDNHAYMRTKPLVDRKPESPEEGLVYVVTPSCDDSRGRELKHLKANEDIIASRWSEGPNTVGGMLMDVNPERIEMTLYNRYGEVQDSFTVPCIF